MRQKHYDIAILGESLAARVAAALLARRGYRVAFFREPHTVSPWLFSSFHLQQLLLSLGGRSCAASARPLQILTPQSRWEIHGRHSKQEELFREFPDQHEQVTKLLKELAARGERLERSLWRNRKDSLASRPLHANLRARGLFRLFRKPLFAAIEQTLGDSAAAASLITLFEGVSGQPIRKLSLAEGALLWSWVRQHETVSVSGLEELLLHRFDQFHGDTLELAEVATLTRAGRHLQSLTLKDGGVCSADHFVLGSLAGAWLLPPPFELPTSEPTAAAFVTSPLARLSPMLARRMILRASSTIRLTLTATPPRTCRIETIPSQTASDISSATLREELTPIFPFIDFTLSEAPSLERIPALSKPFFARPLPGLVNSVQLQGNLLLAEGASVWPALGLSGDILVGYAVAERLSGKAFKND
ncbi:hypothetical protein [Desulfuromonas sp. AOP6]|uniref:hypothetical protein n=1 Tax=Desulfuromonas sp. AOP6 TaxID=1566351 RepID=UPI0012811226|nr:hypothetical protein [Desulfuromonas sp. AOP6]BCA80062.1 hypothetical protein AOP6_1849 [Desulfuromonas sp. AOP6]